MVKLKAFDTENPAVVFAAGDALQEREKEERLNGGELNID
jgi:hypothetical protein